MYTVDADAIRLVQEVSLVKWMENYHNATYVVMIDRPLSPHLFYLKKKVGMGWEKNEFGERVFENWNAQRLDMGVTEKKWEVDGREALTP